MLLGREWLAFYCPLPHPGGVMDGGVDSVGNDLPLLQSRQGLFTIDKMVGGTRQHRIDEALFICV